MKTKYSDIPGNPCHTFKANSTSSKKVKLLDKALTLGKDGKLKGSNQRKNHRKNKRDNAQLLLPVPSDAKPILDLDPDKKYYFSGEDDSNVIPKGLPSDAGLFNVHINLKVISGLDGMKLNNAFTLVPRKDVKNVFPKKSFIWLKELDDLRRKKGVTNNRGSKRLPASPESKTVYTTAGPFPNRSGLGCNEIYHGIGDATRDGIRNIIHQVERLSNRYIPSGFMTALMKVKQVLNWPTFKGEDDKETSYYPSISVGKNVYLPMHTDEDAFFSATFVVANSKLENDSEILNYFCFPTLGYAVALRQGDVLFFNPLIPHCVSSKRVSYDVICCSLYMKSKLVGGNNNSIDFTENQKLFKKKLEMI